MQLPFSDKDVALTEANVCGMIGPSLTSHKKGEILHSMKKYTGSCHCGAISFSFVGPDSIDRGLRCNCSICRRKAALMSAFTLASDEIEIDVKDDSLATYEFGSGVAKHHFCKKCGIYPFHQTMRKPGHYRINLACIDGVDSMALPFDVFDGASI